MHVHIKNLFSSFSKFFIAFLIALTACTGKPKENTNILVVGTSPDYPNYEFIQDGRLVGFEIDLITEISNRLNKKIQFVERSFESLIPELQSKSIDMIASGLNPTEKRRNSIDFSEIFFSNTLYVLSKNKISNITDLTNKKLGVQTGTRMEQVALLLGDELEFSVLALSNNNIIVEDLKNGRLDFVLLEKSSAHAFARMNENLVVTSIDDISINKDLPNLYSKLEKLKNENGAAFGFRKGDPLINDINIAIEQLKNEGFIDELSRKWNME